MNKPRRVKCLDATYDEDNGFMVLNLLFLDMNEKRIIAWHKEDFLFKGDRGVPDIEMLRTSKMIKGKEFNLVVDDDPNRQTLTETQQMQYAALFNKKITQELDKVTDGLADEEGQIARKLYKMNKDGKLNLTKLYEKESTLRNRLGLA